MNNSHYLSRFSRGIASGVYSQFITIGIQVLTIPLLIKFWGIERYGAWILFTAIVTYLAMSDFGFCQAATNSMIYHRGAKNDLAASRTFSSITLLLIVVIFLIIIAVSLILQFPVMFNASQALTKAAEYKPTYVIFALTGYVCAVLLGRLINSALKANGDYALATFLDSTIRLLEQISVIIIAFFHSDLYLAALSIFFVRLISLFIQTVFLTRRAHWLNFNFCNEHIHEIKKLLIPAIAYLGFPLAHAIGIQGVTLLVGSLIGAKSVVIFNTTRTLSRLGIQLASVVNSAAMPEYAFFFGASKFSELNNLVKRNTFWLCIWACIFLILLSLTGKTIITLWTQGEVVPPIELVFWLGLAAATEIIWGTLAAPQLALNQHVKLVLFFTIYSTIILIVSNPIIERFGVTGAGIMTTLLHFGIAIWSGIFYLKFITKKIITTP